MHNVGAHVNPLPQQPRHTASQPPNFRACSACRDAHSACDPERPCRRCARLGRGAQCFDAPPGRKRGHGATTVAAAVLEHQPPLPSNVYVRPKTSREADEEWATASRSSSSPSPSSSSSSPMAHDQRGPRGGYPQPTWSAGGTTDQSVRHRLEQMQRFNPWPHERVEGYGEHQQQQQQQQQQLLDDGLAYWRSGGVGVSGGFMHDQRHNLNTESKKRRKRERKVMTPQAATTATANTTTLATAANEQRRCHDLEEMVARLESRLEQVTSAFGDQVRLLSASNAQLLDKVKRLETQLTATASPQSSELPLSSSGTSTPSSSAFSFELSVLHSGIVPALALEARQQLPWLCHYELPARFAVPSFSYPIAVFSKLFSLEVPPVCSYVNEAFVGLAARPWHELIGQPYSALFTVYNDNDRRFTSVLYNQRPMSPSEVFSFNALLRCGDGRMLRLCDQSQFFYDFRGQAQHVVLCVLNTADGEVREGEQFDRWVPLPYVHDPQKAAENRV